MDLATDRLWTAEETARFLGVPKATLTSGAISVPAPRLAGLAATFVIILMMSLHGSVSSKRQHECVRPVAQDQTMERRSALQGT